MVYAVSERGFAVCACDVKESQMHTRSEKGASPMLMHIRVMDASGEHGAMKQMDSLTTVNAIQMLIGNTNVCNYFFKTNAANGTKSKWKSHGTLIAYYRPNEN